MPSPNRQKSRPLLTKISYPPIFSGTDKSPVVQFAASTDTWEGKQVTVSEGHAKGRDGRYHSGGEFYTSRVHANIPTRDVHLDNGKTGLERRKYSGPVNVEVPHSDVPGKAGANWNQDSTYLDKVGAEAIHAVDPTNPNAQLGVDLGEFVKDRYLPIPAIQAWKRRTQAAQAAGSEYLNAQFGWMPLVNDMKNVGQSVRDGNTMIENYDAASGTLVHREFAFPDQETITEEDRSGTHCKYSSTTNIAAFNQNPAKPTIRVKTLVRRWFSGSFTYYAGGKDTIAKCLGIGSEADKLFGLSLTPDLVWELTPWSWAVDWFSNAGGVISNATSFGLAGLVMKYGYIMEETHTIKTISMPDTGLIVHGSVPSATIEIVTKRRREANPFGFGLSWEGLSPTQLAISAALGITRLR